VAGLEETADVAVIGGGVAGLTIALELAEAGRSVRVLEAGDFEHGTSHGNAGLLCPSYVTPIASPKVLLTAIGWLLRGEGPFTLSRAPWHGDMGRWITRFLIACGRRQAERAIALLAGMARESIDWYDAFAQGRPDFGFAKKGWLYVYATREALAEGELHAKLMARAGVQARVVSSEGALEIEPSLRPPTGAILFPGDAHLDSHAFIGEAVRRCRSGGVRLDGGTKVLGLMAEGTRLRVSTSHGDIIVPDVVLATGSSAPLLCGMLGARLPILSARGHSITLVTSRPPQVPLLFAEAHLVVTPMLGRTRMTTGLELGSESREPDAATVEAMARDAGTYLRHETPGHADSWVGFRPLTPDGLPVIGRLAACPRVIVASGYGTLGMTLAPAAARIVKSLLEGGREPALVSPARFGA